MSVKMQAPPRISRFEQPTFTDLLKTLREETTTLIRQEISLAKTEMSEKAQTYARYGKWIGAGVIMSGLGVSLVLLAISLLVTHLLVRAGLDFMTSLWLGPLIVGAIVAMVGYAIVRRQITRAKENSIAPSRTLHTLAEDQQWIKQKLS